MKALCNKITQHICQSHDDDYALLCIEKDCKHKQRMMCGQCVKLNNPNELINIKKVFKFFESQEINQASYLCKSKLQQQFNSLKSQLIEQINKLEQQMETLIESIKGNDIVKRIQSNYFNRDLTNKDIQSLGSELIGGIIIDSNGNYQLQNDNFSQQDGYIKSMEILKAGENVIELIRQKVNSILIEKDITKQQYVTSETIQLKNKCAWLCFNHNQTYLAAAVYSSIIIYKQSEEGQWIADQQLIDCHSLFINQVKFNHNSTQLASCSYDKLIIIWNKKSDGIWKIHNELKQHSGCVKSICYNHNSTVLASGSDDRRINIYVCNDNNWILKQSLPEHTSFFNDVCFNHDSKLLASGSGDSIILWECNWEGKWIVKQKLIKHIKSVFRVSFNSNSTQLLSGSEDKSIKIWSVDNSIWKCSHTLTENGHKRDIRSVYFNSQSNMIVSSSDDKSIKIWRINKQNNWECSQTINTPQDYVKCAILSSDCSMIISGSHDKMIKIHRLNKQQQKQQSQECNVF